MRSAPSTTHRRLHPCPEPPSPLQAIARLVDELAVDEPGHLLVHVLDEPGPELALGTRPFDRSVHPFDVEIAELDINPVFAYPKGLSALDVKIKIV